jgi:hypothetical protein
LQAPYSSGKNGKRSDEPTTEQQQECGKINKDRTHGKCPFSPLK